MPFGKLKTRLPLLVSFEILEVLVVVKRMVSNSMVHLRRGVNDRRLLVSEAR